MLIRSMVTCVSKRVAAGLSLAAFCLVLIAGCDTSDKGHTDSSVDAVVGQEQFQRSYSIVASLSYLPFEFALDGCYARALYVAMELAAEGIPSSATFAIVQDPAKPLKTAKGVTWRYHVAAMIKLHPEDEGTIIDPSMGHGSHLSLHQWIKDMGYAGANPTVVSVEGSLYSPSANVGRVDDVIDSFDKLKPFRASDIQHACNTMYNYLAKTGNGVEQRRAVLLERTNSLMQTLGGLGKLVDDLGAPLACGS